MRGCVFRYEVEEGGVPERCTETGNCRMCSKTLQAFGFVSCRNAGGARGLWEMVPSLPFFPNGLWRVKSKEGF